MAGNKKPARSKGKANAAKIAPGSLEGYFGAQGRALELRTKERAKRQSRVDQLNNTPLGHPMNRKKIDRTFAPLEKALDDAERTGTHLFDEDGDPVMYMPEDRQWTSIITGVLHMCFIFEKVGSARVWSKMPPGLRIYALGLQIGRKLDPEDFTGARETIAWMRKNLATMTPIGWKELFDWATELDLKERANG